MEQINKISKMCDAKVHFTWPGFSECAEGGKSSKLKKKKKGKGKKKKKKEDLEKEENEEEGAEPPSPPPHAAQEEARDEEGEQHKKKKKLECEACTRGPAAPSNARRAALWCCTRCVLMFCGAMRMFVAAAGVLGLCLTVFFIFAPSKDRQL